MHEYSHTIIISGLDYYLSFSLYYDFFSYFYDFRLVI